MAVQPKISPLAHAFKLHEHLSCHILSRECEVLAIPDNGISQVYDVNPERLITVEGVGQRDLLPCCVVVFCILGSSEVAHLQTPVCIKV